MLMHIVWRESAFAYSAHINMDLGFINMDLGFTLDL